MQPRVLARDGCELGSQRSVFIDQALTVLDDLVHLGADPVNLNLELTLCHAAPAGEPRGVCLTR